MHVIAPLPPGLIAVVGDEQTGKTTYLRRLAGDQTRGPQDWQAPDARWCDLSLPGCDDQKPGDYWAAQQTQCPQWDAALADALVTDLGLTPHLEKQLFMLSTGSRRKVGLVGLLASGASMVCLDQPFAALDAASIQALRKHLQSQAHHPVRSWVVADYVADPQLPWARVVRLDIPASA